MQNLFSRTSMQGCSAPFLSSQMGTSAHVSNTFPASTGVSNPLFASSRVAKCCDEPAVKATALSKSQVAQAYSPQVSPSAALNRLRRWIEGDRELCQQLQLAGYQPSQRILTARQVALIYEYIGQP